MLMFLIISISAVEIYSQCVQCKPSRVKSGGLSCQTSTSGGRECQSDGVACTIVGVCSLGFNESSSDSESFGDVQVDDAILEKIAEKHPRFAIALSLAAKSGYIGRESMKVSVLPVEITKEDFDKWREYRRAELSNKPLDNFGGFAKKLSESDETAAPVTYSVSTEQINDSTAAIKFDVEEKFPSDPDFLSLEITLVKVKETASKTGVWKIEKWQLK